jgi:hypothetical protein
MAYMNQERKAKIAPVVKAICKKYGVKATMSVSNHSTLCLNIKESGIDFIGDYNLANGQRIQNPATTYIDVNPYWYREHFTGVALNFLTEVLVAMNAGNWDRSDIQTDYFDVGWYVGVNIGKWNKPYILTA